VTAVVFSAAARDEALEAQRFYAALSPTLGERFAAVLDRAVAGIGESQTTWPQVSPRLRRHVMSRFPYVVLYRVERDEVLIVSVAHQRRQPVYWRRR
jgi:plasmid stabilization system protein ParE